ncbi:hypothetical protein SUGI_0210450 [Cryptomeria japonica]|nr:hypothetical protein SUGI_0210450 [Cryptomeria japonica]
MEIELQAILEDMGDDKDSLTDLDAAGGLEFSGYLPRDDLCLEKRSRPLLRETDPLGPAYDRYAQNRLLSYGLSSLCAGKFLNPADECNNFSFNSKDGDRGLGQYDFSERKFEAGEEVVTVKVAEGTVSVRIDMTKKERRQDDNVVEVVLSDVRPFQISDEDVDDKDSECVPSDAHVGEVSAQDIFDKLVVQVEPTSRQDKCNGGIAELVSSCPITPEILPTPIIYPTRKGLADMMGEGAEGQ